MILFFSILFACQETTKSSDAPEAASKAIEAKEAAPQAKASETKKIQSYGAPFTIDKAMPAAALLGDPEKYVGQNIRIEGKVSDVCQKMGCWMVISEADKHMRITTKDHKFFVAKDGAGNHCHIEGKVISRELDAARTAHFESETSKDAPMPEKQAKDNKTYEIVASSIQFLGKK